MARSTRATAIALRKFITRDQAEASEAERLRQLTERLRWPPVLIHLYCTAPGCEDLPSNHDDVWRWLEGCPPEKVLRRVLTRLERPPHLVIITQGTTWTDIEGDHPLCPDREYVPLAAICQGMTFDQVTETHQSLIDSGWRPRPAPPALH